MAPFTLYPSRALLELSHLSNAYQRQQSKHFTTECGSIAWEILPRGTSDAISDKVFTQFMPFSPTAELHATFQTLSALSVKSTNVAGNTNISASSLNSTGSTTRDESATGQLSSSAIVGITLAFASVLLGLGAMTLTRTRWCRRKRGVTTGKNSRVTFQFKPQSGLVSPPEMKGVESKERSLESILEQENSIMENGLPELQYIIEGEYDETEEPEFTGSIHSLVAEIVEEHDGDVTDTESQDSCSSKRTATQEETDVISCASSSRTSIGMMSEDWDEEEEEEERGYVHRAQTQSVEIKRAVLINIPAK